MKTHILVTFGFLVLVTGGCERTTYEKTIVAADSPGSSARSPEADCSTDPIRINSSEGLVHEVFTPKAVSVRKVPSDHPLTSLFFLDERVGWIGSEGEILGTTDAGATWNRTPLAGYSQWTVREIRFVGPARGWAIVERKSFSAEESEAAVLLTTDGGHEWKTLYRGSAISIRSVSLDSPSSLIVGSKFTGFDRDPLILASKDNRDWTDISTAFSAAFEPGRVGPQEELTKLVADTDGSVRLVTSEGRIFRSDWRLQDWTCETRGLENDYVSRICACHSGVDSGSRLWMAGGRFADEGVYSFFGIRGESGWTQFVIEGIYLKDIEVANNGDVFAGGTILKVEAGEMEKSNGVISYTRDGGRNWAVVFESGDSTEIGPIVAVDPGVLFAVDDKGNFIKIVI